MFIILSIIIIFPKLISGGYIETVSASGCESCRIYLTCRKITSIIAISEANFIPNQNTSTTIENSTPFPPPIPRQCLNRRCSGNNHCSFILIEDCPGAEYLKEGTLYIEYMCISDDRVVKYCNKEITLPNNHYGVSEGFIHNPGYPRFYGGQSPCRWKIKAANEQRVQLTIFDLSVIVDNPVIPGGCTEDHLEIVDSDIVVYSTCEQREPPKEILSISDSLEIVLYFSQKLTPLRGFLIHYTAVGCPIPIPPADSYLIYINDTSALFSCCIGYVFPDTRTRNRYLTCQGSKWNEILPLPNCEQIELDIEEPLPKFSNLMASDIVLPILIIVVLFAINSVVLFYIYRAKQRNEILVKEEEIAALNSQELTAIVP